MAAGDTSSSSDDEGAAAPADGGASAAAPAGSPKGKSNKSQCGDSESPSASGGERKRRWLPRFGRKRQPAEAAETEPPEPVTGEGRYIAHLSEGTCFAVTHSLATALRSDTGGAGDGNWCYDIGLVSGNYEDVPPRDRIAVIRHICENERPPTLERLRQTRAAALVDLCQYYNGNRGILPAAFLLGTVAKNKKLQRADLQARLGGERAAALTVVVNHLAVALRDVAPAVRKRVLREGYAARMALGVEDRKKQQAVQDGLVAFFEDRLAECQAEGGVLPVPREPPIPRPPAPHGGEAAETAPSGTSQFEEEQRAAPPADAAAAGGGPEGRASPSTSSS